MTVHIGISSLSDLQSPTHDGRSVSPRQRLDQIVSLAVLADELGLDIFGLGEHHSEEFVVSSPAVVLTAAAARTSRIRLTSSVSVLSVLDPVRLYQDFATLDLLSAGRAEITVGRSAFAEPFALFGEKLEDYDDLFTEKLDLLLRVNESPRTTWSGRFRPPLADAPVVPRALQSPLPVWLGVGGSAQSAVRAGTLGLPMIIGYLGGSPRQLAQVTDLYRSAGEAAGKAEQLRVGIALHYFGSPTMSDALATYPHYHDFLRPKKPQAPGFTVTRQQFEAGIAPGQALMIGPSEHVIAKLIELYDSVRFDRIQALVDWGGLPEPLVHDSLTRLGREIAPAIRAHSARG